MQFTTIFNKEPEGGYTVEVLELPGCVSYGETLEEAKTMIKEAIQAYIESLQKHGEHIPQRDTFISSLFFNETIQTGTGNKIFAESLMANRSY